MLSKKDLWFYLSFVYHSATLAQLRVSKVYQIAISSLNCVNFARKDMDSNFLAQKIERWFIDNSGKVDKELTFRFRGKGSFQYIISHLSY